MNPRRLPTFLCIAIGAALAVHLAWSAAIATALLVKYPHKIFDLRRWDGVTARDRNQNETRELVARFLDSSLSRPHTGPKVAFFGSSVTFAYPWQQSVAFSSRYAELRRDALVLNVSILAGGLEWLSSSALCGMSQQRVPLDATVLELPIVNETANLVAAIDNGRIPRPLSLSDCPEYRMGLGYFPFVVAHPIGLGWIPFVWDHEAYPKLDEGLKLQKVPVGYFTTREKFVTVETLYRERIAQLLRNAQAVGGRVYAFPSPLYLEGLKEIGEDSDALRHQHSVTMAACRSVSGVVCLDPTALNEDRGNFLNLTHMNQRGHRAMGEWLAREIAVP